MAANYIVTFTKQFTKMFDKLTPAEQKMVSDKLERLEDDPFYPSLRSKKLRGRPGYYEFSVNMNIRVIWYYENGRVILLVKVGGHDIIDKFTKR